MKYTPSAFTLIELVVAATILVVITSIGFYSYTQNISDARDGTRNTDLAALDSQLKLYNSQRWKYPLPGEYFEIHNRSEAVAYQWFMDNSVALSTATTIPKDPDLDRFYTYSTTVNAREYQLALTLENSEDPYARVSGDYKSVSKTVLPSLVLALDTNIATEINASEANGPINRRLFVLDTWFHNLPYDFINEVPFSDGSDFDTLLSSVEWNYIQNSDFRNCSEIFLARKHITPEDGSTTDEYQVRNSSWALSNTGCTFP